MTAIEWLEMEIVKLEREFAIPGKVYELCEEAKIIERSQMFESQDGDYCAVCGSTEFWNDGVSEDEEDEEE